MVEFVTRAEVGGASVFGFVTRADFWVAAAFGLATPADSAGGGVVGCVACCVASGAFPPTRRPIRADARKTYSTAGLTAVHVPQNKPNPSHPPKHV